MLRNINTSYFIKTIFSYIEEGIKLKLVKYNKILQKILELNLFIYRIFSGRYIVYESNNKKAKEYNIQDILVFEGEYLNGYRNGKGKEYKLNQLVFEGEYLNGLRNGKGKEYNNINLLIFEGEYKYGKRWTGKFFYEKGIYELKEGKGTIKEQNDYYIIYEGEYLNGLKNGKGKEYLDYGKKLIFEGEYFNGKKWNGKAYYKNKIYLLKNGKGFIRDYNFCYDTILEGEYLHGEKNRKGKEYYDENQLYYEGEYLNGKKSGKGKLYYPNGELEFDGEFLYGYKKRGKKYFKEKLVFEGDYLLYNIWNGKGYDEKGNIIYELINGNGKVKEYNNSGILEYEGEYKNGKRNGKGKEYDEKGKLIFEGEFKNGNKLGVNNQ